MRAPFFAKLGAAIVAVALSLSSALARDPSSTERAELNARVESFNAAMRGDNHDALFEAMPPKIAAAIAKRFGVDEATLKAQMSAALKASAETAKIESFGMAVDEARFESLPDGMLYARIPSQSVIAANGAHYEANNETLAVLDGERWYLMRVDEPAQVELLRSVYPVFAEVEFTPGTIEELAQ